MYLLQNCILTYNFHAYQGNVQIPQFIGFLHISVQAIVDNLKILNVGLLINVNPNIHVCSFRDWAQREAYLEMRRREAAGLPYIDRNLIPEENVVLPTDEELGETEIII